MCSSLVIRFQYYQAQDHYKASICKLTIIHPCTCTTAQGDFTKHDICWVHMYNVHVLCTIKNPLLSEILESFLITEVPLLKDTSLMRTIIEFM